MRILLATARRTASSQWTCQSCRHGIKTNSNPNASRSSIQASTTSSSATEALRAGGPVRTRFAPSPTGYLHLGSLRTALFNYLIAKATGGQFLLRIEDTDRTRTVPDAEERLYEDLEWAGIEWDEGPKIGGPKGPYKQSERTAIYREGAETLLKKGHAYRCFCSPERLHALAENRAKQGVAPDYDRTCAYMPKEEAEDRAAKGEAHVIRLLVPDRYPPFTDMVYGSVRSRRDLGPKTPASISLSFDDPILIKSDGFPTYHLANVIDDHLMDITHVIRGSEWISSTPKHLALYQAFDWKPPQFAHVGLLLDKNHQKLSKRTNSIDVRSFRNMGIFPETLTNFVALLGWSHNTGQDVMSMKDLIKNASMKYTKGDAVVGFEKLYFLQKRHAARYASSPPDENPPHDIRVLATKPIVSLLEEKLLTDDLPIYARSETDQEKEDYVHKIVLADAQNYRLPSDFINRNTYFFTSPSIDDLRSTMPSLHLHQIPPYLSVAPDMTKFSNLLLTLRAVGADDWISATSSELRRCVSLFVEQGAMESLKQRSDDVEFVQDGRDGMLERKVNGAWSKLVHSYLRWALLAGMHGPDSSNTMRILGKSECLRRLERAEKVIREKDDVLVNEEKEEELD